MNGISSTLKEEIKKSKEFKHKEKFKFLSALLVTNILVAILCLPSHENPPVSPERILHPGFQLMTLPLTALVNEGVVSLISKDKKIIIEKAYLHELVKTENDLTQFKIEIKNTDVLKISEFAESGMIAVPYIEMKKSIPIHQQGSRYEISL